MKKCKDKEPYNPLPEYLTIGPSDIHGAGILTKEDIPGEVLIEEDDSYHYKKLKTIKKVNQGEELTLKYSLYEICDYL